MTYIYEVEQVKIRAKAMCDVTEKQGVDGRKCVDPLQKAMTY